MPHDVIDWLRTVTGRCRFVTSPEAALRLVPDLALSAPVLLSSGEREEPTIPFRHSLLVGEVAEVVGRSLGAALDGKQREPVPGDEATLAADPLTRRLAELILEAWQVSPRATGNPLLATARLASDILHGAPPPGMARPYVERALSEGTTRLGGLDPAAQGEILADVAWSISMRMSGAWTLAASRDPSVRPTRFHQALLQSRLALVQGRQARSHPDLALIHGFMNLGGDSRDMPRFVGLVTSILEGVEERRSQGALSAADMLLIPPHVTEGYPPEGRALLLSRDPQVVTALFARLSEHCDRKDLERSGFDARTARLLLAPGGTRPLAESLGELLLCLHRWDLISAWSALMADIDELEEAGAPRSQVAFLVPRGMSPVMGCVAAVRLPDGDLQGPPPRARPPWPSMAEAARRHGALVGATATHGLLLGIEPAPLLELALSNLRLTDTTTPPVSVGATRGQLSGGTDGETLAFYGPALSEAVALAGQAPVGEPELPSLMRTSTSPCGLHSRGVVVSAGFLQAMEAHWRRAAHPISRSRDGGSVAGAPLPFPSLPVFAAREEPDGRILVVLELAPGGPYEINLISHALFVEARGSDEPPEAPPPLHAPRPVETPERLPLEISDPLPAPAEAWDPFRLVEDPPDPAAPADDDPDLGPPSVPLPSAHEHVPGHPPTPDLEDEDEPSGFFLVDGPVFDDPDDDPSSGR